MGESESHREPLPTLRCGVKTGDSTPRASFRHPSGPPPQDPGPGPGQRASRVLGLGPCPSVDRPEIQPRSACHPWGTRSSVPVPTTACFVTGTTVFGSLSCEGSLCTLDARPVSPCGLSLDGALSRTQVFDFGQSERTRVFVSCPAAEPTAKSKSTEMGGGRIQPSVMLKVPGRSGGPCGRREGAGCPELGGCLS